jgi:asparagine synthase (glutamine-hydrolysing)
MCSISGIVSLGSASNQTPALERMVVAQHHRGPDDQGVWSGQVGNFAVAVGHTRLAILDLTEAGHQPMFLPDRSHALVFNGEIYNYRELGDELQKEGALLRSRCDTEVMLWALARWGESAFSRFNGMWAAAWLDFARDRVVLSRDRFGIKPLYFYRDGNAVYFSSEIKAILAGAGHRFQIDRRVAARYLAQGLLDAQPETFFRGIVSLGAGENLVLEPDGAGGVRTRRSAYWSLPPFDEPDVTIGERVEKVRETFLDAVRVRLRSDVPVGVLLSGGIDSSSIAAAMRQVLGPEANLHAISATSGREGYDERPFIEQVAEHLGCPVHFVKLDHQPQEWFRLLNEVLYHNDEPIPGFSTVAHYLLMRQARELGITVILSGQGADEILCGYLKYLGFYLYDLASTARIGRTLRTLLEFARRGTVLNQFQLSEAKRYLPKLLKPCEADVLGPALQDVDYRLDTGLGDDHLVGRQRDDLYRFSVPALVHYEDRSSMAWAREIRLPFLDYRLVSMLVPMEPETKLRDGWTKWIMRKAIEPYLPPSITWRKDKQHFLNPQGEWLRHELRPVIERMLTGNLLTEQCGLISREGLKQRYEEYCRQPVGRGVVSSKDIFRPLALELWSRRFAESLAGC